MVIVEQTIRSLLIQSNLVARRVFLARAPQKPNDESGVPYFVFFPVGGTPQRSHNGPGSYEQRLYQVSIFDDSQSRALGIAASLRQRLDGLRGKFDTVHIGSILAEGGDTLSFEQDTRLFHVIQEYTITFRLDQP